MGYGSPITNIAIMKNFYITTAIDYANGSPHLGHAYEKIISDVIARTQRLQGVPVTFLTGLDEHGQKVQQSAEAEGVEPQKFCDRVAEAFQQMCCDLQISNTDYIRTTEKRHQLIVDFLVKLGVSPSKADADAEGIEHHISTETLEAFQKFLRT